MLPEVGVELRRKKNDAQFADATDNGTYLTIRDVGCALMYFDGLKMLFYYCPKTGSLSRINTHQIKFSNTASFVFFEYFYTRAHRARNLYDSVVAQCAVF